MSYIEKPPILSGSTQQQIAAIRDYLFRIAGSLELASNAPGANIGISTGGVVTTSGGGKGGADSGDLDAVRKSAKELRALIIKTADEIYAYADSKVEEYNALYVAKSAYGTFTESVSSQFETTARGISENYSLIQSLDSELQDYMTRLNGEIRRGYIEDPDNPGSYVFGIAISSRLRFSGSTRQDGGYTYYELEGSQTFGLYTATGWQFWIDGHKKGWFDSLDGMLHVANVAVEDKLTFGANWRAAATPGGEEFEIVYVGA